MRKEWMVNALLKPQEVYDIRTTECAKRTLSALTGVPILIWERYASYESQYSNTDCLVSDVINKYGHLPNSYKDFEYVFYHVTTSASKCISFRSHGIFDLKESYLCCDSELRLFLDKHSIFIDFDKRVLTYKGCDFDISFGACPGQETEEYQRWFVGRKFFFDYTTCGFLSVREECPYGGWVHRRPEVLMDIDGLLKTKSSQEWASTHYPYEIVAMVSGEKIVYDSDSTDNESERVMNYLIKAYTNSFIGVNEEILLFKNGISIPPSDILEI